MCVQYHRVQFSVGFNLVGSIVCVCNIVGFNIVGSIHWVQSYWGSICGPPNISTNCMKNNTNSRPAGEWELRKTESSFSFLDTEIHYKSL